MTDTKKGNDIKRKIKRIIVQKTFQHPWASGESSHSRNLVTGRKIICRTVNTIQRSVRRKTITSILLAQIASKPINSTSGIRSSSRNLNRLKLDSVSITKGYKKGLLFPIKFLPYFLPNWVEISSEMPTISLRCNALKKPETL